MPDDHLGRTDQAPSGQNSLGDDDLHSCFLWSSAQESAAGGAGGGGAAAAGLRVALSRAGGVALGPSPSPRPLGRALPLQGAGAEGVQPELQPEPPELSLATAAPPGAAAVASAAAAAGVVDDGEHTQRGDDEIAEVGELTQRIQRKVCQSFLSILTHSITPDLSLTSAPNPNPRPYG